MSDEERVTTDDSSSETESPPVGSDEKCPYCNIYKVMAKSRLFEVPGFLRDRFERRTPLDSTNSLFLARIDSLSCFMEERSNEGCRFCDLIIDAITAWGKEQGIDIEVSQFSWVLKLGDGQFLIELFGFNYPGLRFSVSIFRGTGTCSVSYAMSSIKKV